MKKIKYKNYIITISKFDFKKFKKEVKAYYVNKSRGKPYVIFHLFNGKIVTGAQFILGKTGYRTYYKDGNHLNLTRRNLIKTDNEHKLRLKRKWYKNNKKIIRERSLIYYQQNKEACNKSQEKYENSEKGKAKRLARRTNLKTRYKRNKQTCKDYRDKKFTLTFKEYKILLSKPCYYCDKDITQETGIGLDRIDNRFGYEIGNVKTCCGECNMIRGRFLTVKETKVAAQAIKKYRLSK